jgi:SAM-dependent methyltransferase
MKDKITWEQAILWLRNQPEQQMLVEACYYDDPIVDAAVRYEASEEWQAVRKILPRKTGLALDLGAGRGISSYALAMADWQVTALEPDPSPVVGRKAIQFLAEQTHLPITPLPGYAENIPCDDSQFDLVFGRQVMHHAHDLQTMCREINRILKPGGIFIATREHVISKREDLQIFLHEHPLHRFYGGENAFLLDDYLIALRTSGLQILKTMGPNASIINYFPITQKEWENKIQKQIRIRLGTKITSIILSKMLPLANPFNQYLAKLSDKQNQYPGRLYSFVAVKKKL